MLPSGTASKHGTDAIQLSLRALGIGDGDEVVTVAYTALATVAAIELFEASPVLVDVDPATMTIDVAAVEAAVTERTRAIVAVHLYGTPAALDPLAAIAGVIALRSSKTVRRRTVRAIAKRVGSVGDVGCFSFFLGSDTLGVGSNRFPERLRELGSVIEEPNPLVVESRRHPCAWQTLGSVPRITTRSKQQRTPRIWSR